jgi:nickel-dependent lactate racemase
VTGSREIRLAYGVDGLVVTVPATATVVRPLPAPAVADPAAALRDALRRPVAGAPLRDRVRPGQTVAIAICDPTRPQPRQLMVEAVLDELDGLVRPGDVTVLIATGTHRATTDTELRAMLGEQLLSRVRVVDHDSRDDASLAWCGRLGADVPVWLNRDWVRADVRITTGFVEPHFFAGFSGGPKMVAPGLAGLETVLTLHDARRIGSPQATWGICEGNPVHDDVRAIAAATGVSFALDVVLDSDQRIVAAFGGDVLAMHAVARERVRATAMVAVPDRFDVVVTTNSGYPLDQNLYQAVKGISAAAEVVRDGGTIICAAQCRDGFPDHGGFRDVLASAPTPQALAAMIAGRDRTEPDQWQVQVLARVLNRAQVVVHADGLDTADLRSAHLGCTDDVSVAVAEALSAAGPDASLCVLPEGPQTIAYVDDGSTPPRPGP